MSETVFAVVVTHRRPDELAKSLDVLSTQTRLPDHLIVVDNDGSGDSRVRDLVAGQPISTTSKPAELSSTRWRMRGGCSTQSPA